MESRIYTIETHTLNKTTHTHFSLICLMLNQTKRLS